MALLELPRRSPRGRRLRGLAGLVTVGALALAAATTAAAGPVGVPVTSPGTITGWGNNSYGQAAAPAGSNFAAVAAGGNHSVALKADGTIVSWGDDNYQQVTNTPTGNGYTAIAAGSVHSVALKTDGTIVSWGSDFYQQVTSTPTGNGFTAVAAGGYHSVALKKATAPAFPDAGPATVNGIAGTELTHTFTTTGNPAPTLTATGLPTGLTLNPTTGALTGTPPTAGSFPFALTADNGVGSPATLTVTLEVAAAPAAPMFTDAGPVTLDAVAGTALTREFTVTGNPTPDVTVLDAAKLPTGMTFADGVLSGTPTVAGTYTFILQATNGVNPDLTLTVTVIVAAPPVVDPPATGSLGSLGSLGSSFFSFGS